MTNKAPPLPTTEIPAVRNRRSWWRPQFGLRSLLVFTLVAGVAGGILARWITRPNRQREIVRKLLAARFDIQYDDGVTYGPIIGQRFVEGDYFWQKVDFWHNVVQLRSKYSPRRSAETMAMIAELPDLEEIDVFFGWDKTDAPLPRLACRRRLKLLNIGPILRPGDVSRIAECECLTSLKVWVDIDSSSELAALDRLQQLQSLRTIGPIPDEAVAAWQNLSRLEVLALGNSRKVSGKTLAAFIRRNPKLRRIDLDYSTCTVEVCEALAACRELTHLSLAGSQVTDEGCEHLSHCDLVALNLSKTGVTDRGINLLHCEHLTKLCLDQTPVSPRAFASVSQWPCLELLILGQPAESQDELEKVLRIPTLKKLYGTGRIGTQFLKRHGNRFTATSSREWELDWAE